MSISELFMHSEWVIRIIIASFCGCLIGYERTNRNKEAGIRTHAIISLGSALIMIVSKYGFEDIGGADGARIAAQIVSGIGFLGAGIYDIGIVTTILILLLQTVLHTGFVFRKLSMNVNIHLEINYNPKVIGDIQKTFKKNGVIIYDIKTNVTNRFDKDTFTNEIIQKEYLKKIFFV